MVHIVSVSVNDEVWQLAKEKAISWARALEYGIRHLVYGVDDSHDTTQKIEHETDKAKVEQLRKAVFQMQETIDKLNEEKNAS